MNECLVLSYLVTVSLYILTVVGSVTATNFMRWNSSYPVWKLLNTSMVMSYLSASKKWSQKSVTLVEL